MEKNPQAASRGELLAVTVRGCDGRDMVLPRATGHEAGAKGKSPDRPRTRTLKIEAGIPAR